MSDRDQIEQIKDRLDILSVVQEYVPNLKKSGQNHFGLCPFHQEGSPSFSVNSSMGLFKCFGCGEGGDVITFIEKIEGLDFSHALDMAAKKAGVILRKKSTPEQRKRNKEKARLIEANKLTNEYFRYMLLKHKSGEIARSYVAKRKLNKEVVDIFQIGYAPKGFDNLKKFLLKKGFSQKELVSWGLLAEKNNHSYDKFRDRLMFPIIDHQGDVVGFSGRLIDPEAKGPKYLNSPETLAYKKSEVLFGLYQGKESIRKNDKVIIVEGNVDPLSSHRIGIGYIVAPMGTALTIQQLKLLRRYTNNILLAFDTDSAGQKAFMRTLELAQEVGVEAKALELSPYKDVDDLIVAGQDWPKVIKDAKPIIDYLIELWSREFDLEVPAGIEKFTDKSLGLIKSLDNNITKELYLERVSFLVRLDVAILRRRMNSLRVVKEPKDRKTEPKAKSIPGDKIEKKPQALKGDEKYLAAMLLQYQKWSIDLSNEVEFIDNNILKQIILNEGIDVALEENLRLMKLADFTDKKQFEREMHILVKRIKEDFIKKELKRLKFEQDTDENLQKISQLIQQLAG